VSFAQLNLHPSIQKAIEACGYTELTPVQAKAIPEILAGRDVVACAQTGTGKTAAFVLPSLNYLASQEPSRKPRVLILTPTRELTAQVNKAAGLYGKFLRFNIISIVGGMSYEPQIRDLKRGADIIVATPGRLIDHLENKRVDLSQIEILVLDEADRMLDMGFIEDIEKIAAQSPDNRQTLLFSATVDKSLNKVISKLLKDPVRINLSDQQISAPQIKQSLFKASNMHHKTRMLKHFLNDENIYKAIIFTATKQHCDRLSDELRGDGFAAAPLHGDLRQNVRNRTIDAFRRGKIQFLIATDVAARGLDINDVTHVINYDLPKFNEDYVHRIGRTGRAGKSGEAISFFTNNDMKHLRSIEKYIGQRLTIQSDKFEYADTLTNTRSDAEKFDPENMFERDRREGGKRRFHDRSKSFNDKPRKRFDRDEPRSSKPFGEKRSFNRDEPRSSKPFGKKRDFDDRAESSDRPRKHFDRDDSRSKKSFGDKRSFNRDEPRSGKSFGKKRDFDDRAESSDRPRKRFDRDDSRSSKSFGEKRSFNRDEPRSSKSFGKKRRFDDREDSSDRPRKRFDRDDSRPSKSFGEKRSFNRDEPRSGRPFGNKRRSNDDSRPSSKSRSRSNNDSGFNVLERPVYEFEQSQDNPRVRYKKRVDSPAPRRNAPAKKSRRDKSR
jgi:superfamily II DNA/RNA helicase